MVDRIQEIRKLFDEMVSLNPNDRVKYLLDLGTTVNALRNDVLALLQAYDQSPSFLERPVIDFTSQEADETGYIGRVIGAYRILRLLGKGGMGLVFLAERADGQYRKQVALKLIRHGLDSKDAVQRFLNERQTLALLNHPGIARFLEGGLTEDGMPYIVMEYIDGIRIDEFVKTHPLSLVLRLQLFQKIADAVSYLHRNLIVHRDLKPANILISPEGNPVLLDFGIAKLLHPEFQPDGETLTQAGMWLMTPEYASPEQVRSEPITVACDVYSLGVVLYELLTGQRPYQFKNRLPQEIERVVCGVEPGHPSSVAKPTVMENLPRLLRGDLDGVLLKALEKRPALRYASVQDFAADLVRYLNGKPVAAQKSTVAYRTRKFVRRNWKILSAGLLTVTILLFFSISTLRQSNQIMKERDKAEATTSFIIDLFKETDPEIAQSDSITAREILNIGRQKIETNFYDQQEIKGSLLEVIGQVYLNLGQYAQAESLITEGMQILESQLPEESPEVLQSRSHFAEIQLQKGNYSAADSLFSLLLEQNQKIFGKRSPEFAGALENLGASKFKLGQIHQSVELCSTALCLKYAMYDSVSLPVAESLDRLGGLMLARQEYSRAKIYLEECYQIRRQILGEKHTLVAGTLSQLALISVSLKRFDEAVATFRKSISILKETLGDDHPRVFSRMFELTTALYWDKRYAEAESIHYEIYQHNLKYFGVDYVNNAQVLNNIAGIKHKQNQYVESIPLFKEAVRILKLNLPANHPNIFHYETNLATTLMHTNQLTEAEPIFENLLKQRDNIVAIFPQRIGPVVANYGMLLTKLNRLKEAEQYLREGLELYRKYYKGMALEICLADANNFLGEVFTKQHRFSEAESLLVQSYPVLEDFRGKENLLTVNAMKRIGSLYEAWDKPEKTAFYRNLLRKNERTSLTANLNGRAQWHDSFK